MYVHVESKLFEALLAARENANFGLDQSQITVMKQNKVPALKDSSASFASKGGVIETKPHGHGDVHTLMHQTGVAKRWLDDGVKWVSAPWSVFVVIQSAWCSLCVWVHGHIQEYFPALCKTRKCIFK